MKRSDVLIGVFAVVTTGIAVSRLMPLTPKAVAVVAVDHPGTADLRRTGNPLARHHLIIYTDYECPACRQLDAEIVDFLSQHGDSVVVFYRHFPLQDIHFQAMKAATLAECASKQGRFEEMHELLMAVDFGSNADWDLALVRAAGLDDSIGLRRCMDASSTRLAVQTDISTGMRLGLRGTPAVVAGGKLYAGVLKRTALERVAF